MVFNEYSYDLSSFNLILLPHLQESFFGSICECKSYYSFVFHPLSGNGLSSYVEVIFQILSYPNIYDCILNFFMIVGKGIMNSETVSSVEITHISQISYCKFLNLIVGN